jgi:hypothetical protein
MYDIDIIGSGRIGLGLVKELLDKNLQSQISKISLYSRQGKKLEYDAVKTTTSSTFEDIVGIYLDCLYDSDTQKSAVKSKLNFKEFTSIDDLSNQLCTPSIISSNLRLLILTTKYNLNEIAYLDPKKKIPLDLGNPLHFEILQNRLEFVIKHKIQFFI